MSEFGQFSVEKIDEEILIVPCQRRMEQLVSISNQLGLYGIKVRRKPNHDPWQFAVCEVEK